MDNTLLQSRHGAIQGQRVAASIITNRLRKHGNDYTESQILTRLRRIERERRAPASGFAPNKLYNRDHWWKFLLEQLHLTKLQGPWIHQTTLRYWEEYRTHSPPFSDAESTVKRLKNACYRLGLVSDSDGTPGMKRRRIEGIKFHKLFETAVVAGEDTPFVKPSRASFILVAKRLGIPTRNCAYVGDNPETDVKGAKDVGMTTILVKRRSYGLALQGKDPPIPKPTYRVRALKEIPAILEVTRSSRR